MFILRRVDKKGLESNFTLGRNYNRVSKIEHPKEFQRTFGIFGLNEEDIFAFIIDEDTAILPLYKNSNYYIMTGSGKTFSKISF